MKRVVTGQRNGKSVILEDTEMPAQDMPQGKWTIPWATFGIPTVALEEEDYKKQLTQLSQRTIKGGGPKPGETVLTISVFPPEKELFKEAKEKHIDPVEKWRKYFKDDYGMHTTDTVDYDIILSGELWMEVDDGVEVNLKAGDCVIQNGVRHAWRNKSSKNCVMASVLVGAKREK